MITLDNGTVIRTEPSEVNAEKVRAELQRLIEVAPLLENYSDREFRELPAALQEKVRALTTVVQPTPSGLERIGRLIWQVETARDVCNLLLEGKSAASYIEGVILQNNTALEEPLGLFDGPPPTLTEIKPIGSTIAIGAEAGGSVQAASPASDVPLSADTPQGSQSPPQGRSPEHTPSTGATLTLGADEPPAVNSPGSTLVIADELTEKTKE